MLYLTIMYLYMEHAIMAVHRVSGQIPCISTMYLTMVFDRIAKRCGKGANISTPPAPPKNRRRDLTPNIYQSTCTMIDYYLKQYIQSKTIQSLLFLDTIKMNSGHVTHQVFIHLKSSLPPYDRIDFTRTRPNLTLV